MMFFSTAMCPRPADSKIPADILGAAAVFTEAPAEEAMAAEAEDFNPEITVPLTKGQGLFCTLAQ